MAFLAASLMKSGVLKSGSPKLRLMMSFPCAFNSLAKAAMANVCEVDKLLILSERIPSIFVIVVVVFCFFMWLMLVLFLNLLGV